MKRIGLFFVALFIVSTLFAADVVTLTVNGQGTTKEIATANALRSAIEQTFGVFVSANTAIVNDELVKDEIATVSSGNIQKYTEEACVNLPNGEIAVTLSATVSISKLVTYAKNHGSSAEFAGQTLAMNVKMKELNKQNEEKVLQHTISQLWQLTPHMFDWEISITDPRLTDDGTHYAIGTSVTAKSTEASHSFYEILKGTLRSLSLTSEEIKEYDNINLPYKGIELVSYEESYQYPVHYYLRSDFSKFFMNEIRRMIEAATTSFMVVEKGNIKNSHTFKAVKHWKVNSTPPDLCYEDGYYWGTLQSLVESNYSGLQIRIANFSNYTIKRTKGKKSKESTIRQKEIFTYDTGDFYVKKEDIATCMGFEVIVAPKYPADIDNEVVIWLDDERAIIKEEKSGEWFLTDKFCTKKERLPYSKMFKYRELDYIFASPWHKVLVLDKTLNVIKEPIDLVIPNGVSEIDGDKFEGCESIARVTIPSSVVKIRRDAFSGCKGINSITIPASVEYIEGGAFSDCTSLETVIFNGYCEVDRTTFSSCPSLKKIIVNHDKLMTFSYYLGSTNNGYVLPKGTTISVPRSAISKYHELNDYFLKYFNVVPHDN